MGFGKGYGVAFKRGCREKMALATDDSIVEARVMVCVPTK